MQPYYTPEEIESRSFAIIDEEVGSKKPFTGRAWEIARRLVHTTGDMTVLNHLVLPEQSINSGIIALKNGETIFTDTEMVRSGIPLRRLTSTGNTVHCVLAQQGLADEAKEKGITRSRAAILRLGSSLDKAIIAIGNAPTSLIALLEAIDSNGVMPSLVIGMPVGFVNAAESKELLLERKDIPSLIIRGRRGGSTLAAATVNALTAML